MVMMTRVIGEERVVEVSQRRPTKKPKLETKQAHNEDRSILDKSTNNSNPISVNQYNEDRDIELAIMASRLHSSNCRQKFETWILEPFAGVSVIENGQSSNSNKNEDDPSFIYCSECIGRYL
ncbi:hypothetical protein G4B88_010120 [Cannabis sativa]|uniref:Uncharacterized protein n=1 Tax=Cannabis sativa TaxID=3483 RepID=A0A7J6GLF9_CANSA|nr:hypothetical protein G4B88_010120 [Cannabis sativa]